jgi:hypothetical protein
MARVEQVARQAQAFYPAVLVVAAAPVAAVVELEVFSVPAGMVG